MPAFGEKKLKLIYILDILKKFSDEEHPINANDIVKQLDEYGICAERKSVYNDISLLMEYGYDLIKTTEPKVGWFMGDRDFEVPEIYLLSDAVRSAKFISKKKTKELISKLNSMLSVHQVIKRSGSVYYGIPQKCTNEELYYNIDKISRAIEEKRQIKLLYTSRFFTSDRRVEKHIKARQISPYALIWQDDHYYLVGNYYKYDNLLHLRLDRINEVEITQDKSRHFSEVSEYSDFFDTADYTNKLFGMYTGQVTDIELCCDKSITEQVLDRFSEDIFIKNVTETHFSITVKAAISEALVTFITNYGNKLKVIKPNSLIDMIKQRATDVLGNYK